MYLLGQKGELMWSAAALTGGANTDYVTAIGAATEATKVEGVQIDLDKNTIELALRDNDSGFGTELTVSKKVGIKFSIVKEDDNAFYDLLSGSYLSDTPFAVFALDRPHAAAKTQGLSGNFTCKTLSENQDNKDVVKVSVELVPYSFIGIYKKSA